MKRRQTIIASGFAALLLLTGSAFAQEDTAAPASPPPGPAATQPSPGPQQAAFTPQQLDQLVAPIALYPDQLLAQILMASTYPLEVVEAARWLQNPQNAAIKGDQLAQALSSMDWDPSVKALVPFPRILEMMSQQLEWTQNLGNAFLADRDQVMDSVQHLRQQAENAGTLKTTPQQVVSNQGGAIVIETANPDVLYVPYYNPTLVFGAWPYPDYPPYYFPPPPGYVAGPGLWFGLEFPIVTAFWGWNSFDWHGHDIHINRDRFNTLDRLAIQRDPAARLTGDTWRHDPFHRRGVAYGTPQLQQRFGAAGRGTAQERRAFTDYAARHPNGPIFRGQAAQGTPSARPQTAARPGAPAWRGPTAQGTQPAGRLGTRPQTAQRPAVRPQTPQRPTSRPETAERPAPRPQTAQRPAPAAHAPVAHAPAARAPVARAPVARAPVARAPAARGPVAHAPAARAPAQSAHAPAQEKKQ